MQTSMFGRPRPVTATVTKPKWMQIPNPDAIAKMRSRSLDSNGSTASLTSLLDHDSYNSSSDVDESQFDKNKDTEISTSSIPQPLRKMKSEPKLRHKNTTKKTTEKVRQVTTAKTSEDDGLSAWEQWIIRKAKDDRLKKQEEKRIKLEEIERKMREEEEKNIRLKRAEVVRQSWVEKKDIELKNRIKTEKKQKENEQMKKEEAQKMIRMKADTNFEQWILEKKKEDKMKKQKLREENSKIQEHEVKRKQMAEEKFQQWLKQAHRKSKTSKNSYLSGKMKGYHDPNAYPEPAFVNPVPWQPVCVPLTAEPKDKNTKTKSKPYRWNPEKYF